MDGKERLDGMICPLCYRVMRIVDGRPHIGDSARSLGVRVPPHEPPDVTPEGGVVRPYTGGMSVAPCLRSLPLYRIPSRLVHLVPGARGNDNDWCWRIGEGSFANSPLGCNLQLTVDSVSHGLIEPSRAMPLDCYREALAQTQSNWVIDEN
jgi:hypothetical protein